MAGDKTTRDLVTKAISTDAAATKPVEAATEAVDALAEHLADVTDGVITGAHIDSFGRPVFWLAQDMITEGELLKLAELAAEFRKPEQANSGEPS